VEIYRLSLRAVGVTPKPELKRHQLNGAGAKPRGSRPVRFDSSGTAVETLLYVRDDLPAGARLEGPAIVDQLDSTTVVPPGWRAEVDEWLNIRMQREDHG
jgi:N-methylhydantoinase A